VELPQDNMRNLREVIEHNNEDENTDLPELNEELVVSAAALFAPAEHLLNCIVADDSCNGSLLNSTILAQPTNRRTSSSLLF
jgi:hypothetical protein